MGRRKRRPRRRPSAGSLQPGGEGKGDARRSLADREQVRREHKEEARRSREAARRRIRRRRLIRRIAVAGVVVAAGGGLGYLVISRTQEARSLQSAAQAAATAAGCTAIATMPDRGGGHTTGAVQYEQRPATSGPHAAPLPPTTHVYRTPVGEENAVHNLEHGYVVIYYRQSGASRLPSGSVGALERLAAGQTKVIVSPYERLSGGNSLALAAWDHLQQCPSSITPSQAVAVARGFISMFRGDGEAPEPSAP